MDDNQGHGFHVGQQLYFNTHMPHYEAFDLYSQSRGTHPFGMSVVVAQGTGAGGDEVVVRPAVDLEWTQIVDPNDLTDDPAFLYTAFPIGCRVRVTARNSELAPWSLTREWYRPGVELTVEGVLTSHPAYLITRRDGDKYTQSVPVTDVVRIY